MAGDTDGVAYDWVLQVTFIATVLLGAPMIAIGSLLVDLDDWTARVVFATTVAAGVWFVTAVGVYLYARAYPAEASPRT